MANSELSVTNPQLGMGDVRDAFLRKLENSRILGMNRNDGEILFERYSCALLPLDVFHEYTAVGVKDEMRYSFVFDVNFETNEFTCIRGCLLVHPRDTKGYCWFGEFNIDQSKMFLSYQFSPFVFIACCDRTR